MRSRRIGAADGAAVVLLAAIIALACGGRDRAPAGPLPAANDPREATLALFQAAQVGRTAPGDVQNLVRPDLPADRRAALAVALEPLRRTKQARIVGGEPVGGPDRHAVDVEVALPGEGSARYMVDAVRLEDGTWRIASLAGPGAAWPVAPQVEDEGLSVSPPPRL